METLSSIGAKVVSHALMGLLLITLSSTAFAHNKVVVVPLGGDDVPIRFYYGSVEAFGALETGNIVSSSRIQQGVYSLDFGIPVAGCAVTANKGPQDGGITNLSGILLVFVIGYSDIQVQSRNNSENLVDTDFHFIAVCPK